MPDTAGRGARRPLRGEAGTVRAAAGAADGAGPGARAPAARGQFQASARAGIPSIAHVLLLSAQDPTLRDIAVLGYN